MNKNVQAKVERLRRSKLLKQFLVSWDESLHTGDRWMSEIHFVDNHYSIYRLYETGLFSLRELEALSAAKARQQGIGMNGVESFMDKPADECRAWYNKVMSYPVMTFEIAISL